MNGRGRETGGVRGWLAIPLLAAVVVVMPLVAVASPAGPRNATVLVIRHADKPDTGDGLSPAGVARSKACVAYFQNFKFHSASVKLDAIFATADTRNSRRPRLTVEPLAHALGLAVDTRCKNKETRVLADELRAHQAGKNVLVCWHHGELPELLRALGANPDTLLPGGQWPDDEYGWVILLRYDANGALATTQREAEPF